MPNEEKLKRTIEAVAELEKGVELFDNGDFDTAIACLSAAIRMDSDMKILTVAYHYRGLCFSSKGMVDRAIEDFTRRIGFGDKPSATYQARGICFTRKGLHDRAIEDFSEAIRLDPGRANAYTGRGLSYQKLGNCGKAIEEYSDAIRLDPQNGAAFLGRSTCYAEQGMQNEANRDREKADSLGF